MKSFRLKLGQLYCHRSTIRKLLTLFLRGSWGIPIGMTEPHRLYIDSLPAVVEAPVMLCPNCQSYICDGMEVEILHTFLFVSWNGGNLRHKVLIEGHEKPEWHMVRCDPCLRRQGLECCHHLYATDYWQKELDRMVEIEASQSGPKDPGIHYSYCRWLGNCICRSSLQGLNA